MGGRHGQKGAGAVLLLRCAVAFAAAAVLAPLAWGLLPRLWGWEPMVVSSGSMAPSIRTGDVILVAPVPDGGLRAGAVVTYSAGGHLITHRVVGRDSAGAYVTKGDANRQPDSQPVPREQVVGEVRLLVPGLGWPALRAAQSPVAAAGLAGTVLVALLAGLGSRRRGRRPARSLAAVGVVVLILCLGTLTQAAFSDKTYNLANNLNTRADFFAFAVKATAPVSYWRLGETSGTVGQDAMGTAPGNAPLTHGGGITLGRPGAVLGDPNAATQYSSAGKSTAANVAALSMAGDFSVLAWAKASSYPQVTNGRIVCKYDGTILNYLLAWDSTGRDMRIAADNTAGTRYTAQATVPNDGAWHLHVGTFDVSTSTLRLYRDGVMVNSAAFTGTPRPNLSAMTIGNNGGSSMTGDIDEVAIWDKALSAADILRFYAISTL